jgi:hypothetical protein
MAAAASIVPVALERVVEEAPLLEYAISIGSGSVYLYATGKRAKRYVGWWTGHQ